MRALHLKVVLLSSSLLCFFCIFSPIVHADSVVSVDELLSRFTVDEVRTAILSGDHEKFPIPYLSNIENAVVFGLDDLVVKFLDIAPDALEKYGGESLVLAGSFGRGTIASILLRRGVDPNFVSQHGYTPMYPAALNGETDILRSLIEFGADLNYKAEGFNLISSVVMEGEYETIELLVQAGYISTENDKNSMEFLEASPRFKNSEILNKTRKLLGF